MFNFYRNLFVLIIVVVLVHLAYAGFIRPQADLALEAALQAGQSAPRSLSIILKDTEQEICLILMCFSVWLMGAKFANLFSMQHLFDVDVLKNTDIKLNASDDEWEQGLSRNEKETPLVQVMKACLSRYRITNDVQNTSDAIAAGIEYQAVRLEAENTMIRYLIWAIPSIGFIGTVRGIGRALSEADKALAGDIAEMTNSLGIAFNSTLVALFISIFLMFFLHQLQRMQDGLLVKVQDYCEKYILDRISK